MKRELTPMAKLEAVKAMLDAFGYTDINLTVVEAFTLFEAIDEQLVGNLDAQLSDQDI